MICAVEDEGMYGAEFAYEEGDKVLEADVENIDLEGIVGWAEIFREALKENGRSRFSFTVEGIADNDYDDGEYDAATDALADYFDEME